MALQWPFNDPSMALLGFVGPWLYEASLGVSMHSVPTPVSGGSALAELCLKELWPGALEE